MLALGLELTLALGVLLGLLLTLALGLLLGLLLTLLDGLWLASTVIRSKSQLVTEPSFKYRAALVVSTNRQPGR